MSKNSRNFSDNDIAFAYTEVIRWLENSVIAESSVTTRVHKASLLCVLATSNFVDKQMASDYAASLPFDVMCSCDFGIYEVISPFLPNAAHSRPVTRLTEISAEKIGELLLGSKDEVRVALQYIEMESNFSPEDLVVQAELLKGLAFQASRERNLISAARFARAAIRLENGKSDFINQIKRFFLSTQMLDGGFVSDNDINAPSDSRSEIVFPVRCASAVQIILTLSLCDGPAHTIPAHLGVDEARRLQSEQVKRLLRPIEYGGNS